MSELDLKKRTEAFALRIWKLVDAIPKTTAGGALASQIVRSGTSVAANYRARLTALKQEADELVTITVASIRKTKRGRNE